MEPRHHAAEPPFRNCRGSQTFTTSEDFDPPVVIASAKFDLLLGLNPLFSVTGHFTSATRAAGSMTGSLSAPPGHCHGTKTTSWTAHERR